MPNISHEELAETKAQPFPSDASLNVLKQMREEACSTSMSRDFKLQSNQRFLRRALSPDSPTKNLLMVHGTGVGKTCTAIQIAEEYIVRPEFQDKKVFVMANPSVQDNFKTQIFDISRVSIDSDGLVLSKQCTGRRYLDMIQRSQVETLRFTDKRVQQKITTLANKLIGEFYEFTGYSAFSNTLENKSLRSTENELNKWIHDTFDNRLIIIDEAHNLKETTESDTSKLAAIALEKIVKTANGVTLVLLTATPMYDTYDEILYYINLFLWNERRIKPNQTIRTSDIFDEAGDFKEGREAEFRGWCQDYISYARGENPFTFPFRLPPPDDIIAEPDRETDVSGKPITTQRKYLTLTKSYLHPIQAGIIRQLKNKSVIDPNLICVFPENKPFRESFTKTADGFNYTGEKFLAPSKVPIYSSKFGLIMNILNSSTGMAFVYSNIVESGAQLFAMCLEEHGFDNYSGVNFLSEPSGETPKGSKGKYVIFTSNSSDSEIKKALITLKSPENINGSLIRVVIASPKVSEGVDFRFIRQIHVLDPWFNMSRIEQVLGRGMRTCSHALLTEFEQQNCTVYLHVCRYSDSKQETLDEYIYRTFVEGKAIRIAKVKRVIMESAMDCSLQESINIIPPQWKDELKIPQIRNQDNVTLNLSLAEMAAPTFEEGSSTLSCKTTPAIEDPNHERPLSSILDVKDEILDKLMKLFLKKPIWSREDLFSEKTMVQYKPEVISYIIQTAIDSGFQLKDKHGRLGFLQAKKGMFAFTINERDTMVDRLLKQELGANVKITPPVQVAVPVAAPTDANVLDLSVLREKYQAKYPELAPVVLDWYLLDSKLVTSEEKISFLLNSVDWENPPPYAAPLRANRTDGGHLYIFGPNKVYDDRKQKVVLVGQLLDDYNRWLENAKSRFVSRKNQIFATMEDGTIFFNIDEKVDEVRRASRSKNIGGRNCNNFKLPILEKFARWLDGRGFPPDVKKKEDRCIFMNFIARNAIVTSKEGFFWLTPEEYSIFGDDANRLELVRLVKD